MRVDRRAVYDKLKCLLFGHLPGNINPQEKTTYCYRCGQKLRVSYDMCYGETIVEHVMNKGKGMETYKVIKDDICYDCDIKRECRTMGIPADNVFKKITTGELHARVSDDWGCLKMARVEPEQPKGEG